MADLAQSYLEEALAIIRAESVRRDLDWDDICRDARERVSGDADLAACHAAIEELLAKVDRHSRLRLPSRADDRAYPTVREHPTVRRAGSIGILTLPSLAVVGPAANEYATIAHRALAFASDVEGWVVDLRANSGGNMWPMLVAAGPVLGDGIAGAFVSPEGRRNEWGYAHGSAFLAGKPTVVGVDDPARMPQARPVAVLTSGATKSSGEAMAIAFRGRPATRSFGAPTNGTPTANQLFRLSDGAVLVLTVSFMSDRTGRVYDEPIAPDVALDPASAEAAALAWLASAPANPPAA